MQCFQVSTLTEAGKFNWPLLLLGHVYHDCVFRLPESGPLKYRETEADLYEGDGEEIVPRFDLQILSLLRLVSSLNQCITEVR